MSKSKLLSLLLTLLPAVAFAQAPEKDARSLADQAVIQARSGDTEGALPLFQKALNTQPDDVSILRDYAVVLGWAGKYPQAIATVKKLQSLEPKQPDWALREFAAVYLFGDAKTEALAILDELIARGDASEQTLMRRALALRWMGKSQEAQTAYKTILQRYPNSAEGAVGLAYSIADQGKTAEALKYLETNKDVSQTDPVIVKAKIRLLNWAGRHYEAQTMIASLPANLRDDRDILEDRIAAARWGGNPTAAMQELHRYVSLFPGNASSRMSRDLHMEYGQSFSPSFSYGKDSDGLTDRSVSGSVGLHLNPANVLHVGYQYRWQEQNKDIRTLLQYNLGWSADINRHLALYTSVGSVDYRTPGLDRKFVGDGSIAATLNERFRLSGGGGSMVMDAYQAIPNQVTAPFGFGVLAVNLTSSTRVQTRFSHYSFSDAVVREREGFEFMQTLFTESKKHLKLGWRSDWMQHDGQTTDFWSPSTFQSHMAVAQSEGRVTSWLDYWAEIGSGWQQEPTLNVMHPFQADGKLALHPNRYWRIVMEAGRSTSSLDRVLPGQPAYSRWVAIGGMEFRLP
jgi:tetratricopeptide (TPR) repeat protein